MTVFVAVRGGNHQIDKGQCVAKTCDALAVFTTPRNAWDYCVGTKEHHVGYFSVDVDREYVPDTVFDATWPNCPNNDRMAPAA